MAIPSKIEEKFAREKKTFFSSGETRVRKIENEMEYVIATVIAAGQLSTKQKQKSPNIIRDKNVLGMATNSGVMRC